MHDTHRVLITVVLLGAALGGTLPILSLTGVAEGSSCPYNLGGTEIDGALKIEIDCGGNIGVARYDGSSFVQQYYSFDASDTAVYVDGTLYDIPDGGTANAGNDNLLVSDQFTTNGGDTVVTEYSEPGAEFTLVQRVTYSGTQRYFDITWEVTNIDDGRGDLTDIRLLHGKDTYLAGGDNGEGFWNPRTNTIGVRKDVSGEENRLTLRGLSTPYNYQSNRYSSIETSMGEGELTGAVDTDDHDNGYAMEWRTSALADGDSWTVNARESFTLSSLIVTPPSKQTLNGDTVDLTFDVQNTGTADTTASFTTSGPSGWGITTPAERTISAGATEQVTITVDPPDSVEPPGSDSPGDYDVTLTGTPSSGSSDSGTGQIEVPNDPPTARDDSASADEDSRVTVDVVNNDNDPNGDSLAVTSIINGPSHGSAQITGPSNDQIRFDPGADQSSDVSITYEVSDGNGGTDTATLWVSVNDAPEVSSITRASPTNQVTNADSVDFDVTFSTGVSGVDESDFTLSGDANGTIQGFGPTSASNTITVTVASVSGDGELRLDVTDDGTIRDTANNVALGGIGTSGSADGSFTSGESYTIDNTKPGFSAGSSNTASISEESTANNFLNIDAGDDGTPGSEVSDYSLSSAAGTDASSFSIDSNTGQISLDSALDYETPSDANTDNEYELIVTATDDVGNTNTQTVTVSIINVNEAPTLDTNAGVTVDEGSTANQITNAELAASDLEQSAESITYDVTTAPSDGTLFIDGSSGGTDDGTQDGESAIGTGTFTQADIDAGNLLYSHGGSEASTDTFEFDLTDGTNTVAGNTFQLTIDGVNDAPRLSVSPTDPTFTEDGNSVEVFSPPNVDVVEDGQQIERIELTVSNVIDGSAEKLIVDGSSAALTDDTVLTTSDNGLDVSVEVSETTATVTVDGGSVSETTANTIIDTLAYEHTGDDPTIALNRRITITKLTDDGVATNAGDDTATFSTSSNVSISSANDAPRLSTDARSLKNIDEDAAANSGTQVSTILSSAGSTGDAEDDTLGIAVISVDDTDGSWEYSTDGGSSWNTVASASPSGSSALLLADNDLVRFVPGADFSGSAGGSLTVRAWDQSSGSAGDSGADAGSHGGTTAFSSNTTTVGISVDDAPEVTSITRASPTNQNTNADTAKFDVSFSELVSGVDDGDFALTGTASGNIQSFGPRSGVDTITVTVDSVSGDGSLGLTLTDDGTITSDNTDVELGGVGHTDSYGDGSFTSGESYTIDNTAPTLVDATKIDDTTIEIALSERNAGFDVSSIEQGDFSLDSGTISSIEKASLSDGDTGTQTVIINLDSAVDDDDTVAISLQPDGIEDLNGNTQINGSVSAFRMDGVAPTLADASKVDATTVEVNIFDGGSGIDKASIDQSDFTLTTGTISSIDTSGVSDGATGTQTVTLNLDAPVDTSTLSVGLYSDGIDDKNGNTLSSGSTSVSGMDGVAPTLDGASKIDDTTIQVTLTDGVDIDEKTIDSSDFSLNTGSISYITPAESESNTSVTLKLASKIDADTVDVSIVGSIEDINGNSLTAGTQTVSDIDGVAPTLDRASSVDTTTIRVDISDGGSGIDKASIDPGDFILSSGSISEIDTSGVTDGAPGTQTVIIHLESPVDADSVSVSLQSDGIDDKNGNAQTSGSASALSMDGVAPTLNDTSKIDDTTIQVTFTDGVDVDETSIDASDFSLSSGSIASVTPRETETGAAVDIDLSSPVDTNSVNISITGDINDTSGNSLTSGRRTVFDMDGIAPTTASFKLSNPSKQNVSISFKSDEQLSIINISISGAESTILTRPDFIEGDNRDGTYTYTAMFTGLSDGDYTATLQTAEDSSANDGANGESDSITVDTTAPTVSSFSVSNPSGRNVQVRFTTDEQLATIAVSVSGVESATLSAGDFSETDNGNDTYTYEATYDGSSDGRYTATLDTAEDADGNDGASGDSDSVTVDTTAPIAEAGSSQTVDEGVTVYFDGTNSTDNLNITGYSWEFGDGATASGPSPVYTYVQPGTYTVTLTVTDRNNNTATDTLTVTVEDTTAPSADAGDNRTVEKGRSVQFDGTDSTDNVNITTYQWRFGDGTNTTGPTPTHTYSRPGIYTVALTVSDDGGNTDTDTVVVTVAANGSLEIDTTRTNQSLIAGNTATVAVNVTNSGPVAILEPLTLFVNGTQRATASANLAPNETATVEFQIGTNPATTDDLTITIEGSENNATKIIPVSAPTDSFVVISAIETNSPILTANSLVVTTKVKNVGQTAGTQPLTFSVGNHTQQTLVTLGPNETSQETFSWNPTAEQAGVYTLEITTGRDTATADVSVVTLTDATPRVNTTGLPDVLDFGTLRLTETAAQTIKIQNIGNVTLRTEAELRDNAARQFNISEPAGDVAPGTTEALTVTFDPSTRGGDLTANLTINTTVPDTPTQTITLRGAAESPLINVAPADSLDFGRSTPDQAGSTMSKDIIITNDGNAALEVTNLSLGSGDSFEIDTTAPLTIAAGNSRTISLTYTVPETGGTVTDSLTISSSDPETDTVSVPLRAVVKEPRLFTQPDSIAFGNLSIVPPDTTGNVSREQTTERRLYLQNTGNVPLSNLTVAFASDTKAFKLASDGAVGTLSPSDSGKFVGITAIANQTTLGEQSATLEITADELPSPAVINVTMTATASSVAVTDSITFDDTAVGGATTTAVQIKNTGNATLAVNTSAGFNSSEQRWVTILDTGHQQLTPGETTAVRLQFAPDAATPLTGDLILQTNEPTLPAGMTTIAVTGTGITSNLTAVPSAPEFNAVGNGTRATRTISLTNDGQSAINNLTATMLGDSPEQFTVETDLTNVSLASAQRQPVTIRFEPTTLGEKTALVTFTGTNENGQTITTTVPLVGDSTPPELELTRDTIAFGPVSVVSEPTTHRVGIINNGTRGTTLTVENVHLADPSTPFEIATAPTGTNLASGERADVAVRFAPKDSQTGTFSTELLINTSDPESPTVRLPVSAESRAPEAVIRSENISSGKIPIGDSTEASVTLANDGNDVLTIEAVSIEGPDAGAVSLTRSHDGRILAPGSERQITVEVTPSRTGPLAAALKIQTDDPFGLTHTNGTAIADNAVPLTVTGVTPALSVTPTNTSEITIGETPVGSTASKSVRVANTGDAPLIIAAPEIRADSTDVFTLSTGPTKGVTTIGPGESLRYRVRFTPETRGTATARLVFPTTNDDNVEHLTFDLSGKGINADVTVSRDFVDFKQVEHGNSKTASFSIHNDGAVNTTVTDVVIAGTDANFFETSLETGTIIEADTTRTESVTTTPTMAGDLTAVMGVSFSDGTDRTITLRVTSVEAEPDISEEVQFADTRVGHRSERFVTLGNNGNRPYTIESVSVTGDINQFEQNLTANLEGKTVAGGDTISAPLVFAPTDDDEALNGNNSSLMLVITTDVDATTHTVAVDAMGVTPDFTAPDIMQFGEVPLGKRVTRNITVRNTPNATAPITLEDTKLGGEDPTDFEIVNRDAIAEKSLKPGESVEIAVAFTPSEPVRRSASLRLETNDPRQPSKIISLTNSETYVVVKFGSVLIDYFNTNDGSLPKTDVYDGIERDGAFDSFNLTAARDGDISVKFTDVTAENESTALAAGFAEYDRSEFDSKFDTVRILETKSSLSAANFTKGTLEFRVTKATLDEAGVDITNQTDVENSVGVFHSHQNAEFETQNTTLVADRGTSFIFETTFTTFSTSTVSIKSFNPTLDTVNIPAEVSVGESITADATVTNVGGHSGDAVVELEVDGTQHDSSTQALAAGATQTVSGLESTAIDSAGTVNITVTVINDETAEEIGEKRKTVSVSQAPTASPEGPENTPSGGESGTPPDRDGETVGSRTSVSIGATGVQQPDDKDRRATTGETDTGGVEPRPPITISVENPRPGQTLVINGTGAAIVDQGATAASDSIDRASAGGRTGFAPNNVRIKQLTVDIDTDRNFELSVTAYNDDLTPSASILRGDTASAQAETRGVSNDVWTAAQSFESQTGTISAGYLKINTTLAPEQVTNGSIEFSIRRSYLHELGVEPEDITLYRQLSDGRWEELATAYRNSGERYHHFEGTTSKFSMFVIDTDAPQLDVTNSRLAKTKIETGETVTATATVTNRGLTAGETTVNLTVGGAVVDTETVVVESGDSKDVTLSFDGGEPGKYDLTVGGSDLETLTIDDAEEATPSPTPMNGDTPAAGAIDGSSPLLAVTILLLVLLAFGLWWRRTE